MRPKTLTLTLLTPDADGIATSQTPASGGVQSLTLDGAHTSGGAFSAATAHQISITAVGNESGRTFTVTGTDQDNLALVETITGPNATTVESSGYFKTITSITVDNDTANAITVGTVDEAISPSYNVDNSAAVDVGLGLVLSGTINATVQHCIENMHGQTHNDVDWFNHSVLASQTASAASNYASPVSCVRLVVNSYTAGATAALHVLPSRS